MVAKQTHSKTENPTTMKGGNPMSNLRREKYLYAKYNIRTATLKQYAFTAMQILNQREYNSNKQIKHFRKYEEMYNTVLNYSDKTIIDQLDKFQKLQEQKQQEKLLDNYNSELDQIPAKIKQLDPNKIKARIAELQEEYNFTIDINLDNDKEIYKTAYIIAYYKHHDLPYLEHKPKNLTAYGNIDLMSSIQYHNN